MLEGFLPRFVALVETLEAHALVRVTHSWIGAPATDAMLSDLARAWGHPVPPALRALYRQANGLQLRWVDVGHEHYDPARDDRHQEDGPWSSLLSAPGEPAGYLDIPTLAVLEERDTVGAMFDAPEDYLHRAVAFDTFGESQDAVVFFGDGVDDPWISVASDNLADVDPPGTRTLSQYLDHVVKTWAFTKLRSNDGPRVLDRVLRHRIALDPARLVGQRVVYRDDVRGSSLLHGTVRSLSEVAQPPRHWPFGPTVVEVRADFDETVYVPFRALYPPDSADDYEPLFADPGALRALLRGAAEPLFEALASVAPPTYGSGMRGGPVIAGHAWPFAGLTSRLDPAEAVRALFFAAQTLFAHPESWVEHSVSWPVTRPPHLRPSLSMSQLGLALFDAAVLHIGRAAPSDLGHWLGADDVSRLSSILRGIQSRTPLRGYDPLTDPSTTASFVFCALRGGPTTLDLTAQSSFHGGELGLGKLRVVGA